MALVNHSVTLALCAESTISCCSLCWMHSTFFKSSFCSQRWFFCCIFFFCFTYCWNLSSQLWPCHNQSFRQLFPCTLPCYTKRRKAIFSLIVSHYKHNPAYKQSESVGKIFDTKMIFCNLSNDHKTFEEIAASWNLSAVVNSVQAVFNQLSVIHYLVVLALLEALKYWLLSLKSLNYNPWVPRLIFLGLHAYHNSLCMLSHQNACLDAWDGLCDVFFWAVLLWLKSNHLFLLA